MSPHEEQDRRNTKFPNVMGFWGTWSYTAKKSTRRQLGMGQTEIRETLIHGLTTFAHKLSIPP